MMMMMMMMMVMMHGLMMMLLLVLVLVLVLVHWSTPEPRDRLGTDLTLGTEARCVSRGSVSLPSFVPSLGTEARCCGLPRLGESAAHRGSVQSSGGNICQNES